MKKNSTKAFAPANISLIFTVEESDDPRKKGSRGVGFTIDKGVTAKVSIIETDTMHPTVLWKGISIDLPTVVDVITTICGDQYNPNEIKVELTTDLPLGCGFGLSGASALSTAYALSELLHRGKSTRELAEIAHHAEVKNHTGLGDVVNQYFGGFCIKQVVSSTFLVEQLPFGGTPIFYKVFGQWFSKKLLTDEAKKKAINDAGSAALLKLKEEKISDLNTILKLSYQYIDDAGLINDQKVKEALESIYAKGSVGSMILIGKGVVSDRPFEGATKANISNKAAHIL